MSKKIHSILTFILIASVAVSVSATEKTPYFEIFGSLPSAENVRLSPEGTHIAYFLNRDGYTYVVSNELSTNKVHFLSKTDNKEHRYRWLKWANNQDILVSVAFPENRYAINVTDTRMLKMSANNYYKSEQMVNAGMRSWHNYEHYSQLQDQVIDIMPEDPDHILMALDLDSVAEPGVYKLNINSKKRKRLKRGMDNVRDWIVDRNYNIRVAIGSDHDEHFFKVKDLASDNWNTVWRGDVLDRKLVDPLGFGLDPNLLYVRKLHEGKQAIFIMDVSKKEYPLTLIASDPLHDINGSLIYSRKTQEVVGVHHEVSRDKAIYWDGFYKKFQEVLNKALPDTSNYIVSMSDDKKKYIVFAGSSSDSGTYYFGDRDKKLFTPFIDKFPKLSSLNLSGKKKISYAARDGLNIEGYLTLPENYKDKPVPTIIFPHGGPSSRVYDNFNLWSEFFAKKGFAVLQPNFRGSSGYGFDFEEAGFGSYGLKMQDDLSDAAEWMVKEGIADEEKMCIVGTGYGGYAALMATVKTPELFSCAISFAGFSDLSDLRVHSYGFVSGKVTREKIGYKKLGARSPVNGVEKIKTPILLIHGEDDRTISVEQSRDMASKLKGKKKEFKYVEIEDGDHNLSNQTDRLTLFSEMDAFLDRTIQ